MTPQRAPLVVLALTALGTVCGYVAGPYLARASDTVQLATQVWHEESERLEERSLESEAFHSTGEALETLLVRARSVERGYVWGGALLGAWCGLALGVRLVLASRMRRETVYHIDHGACVACCRCFLSCPREHVRLKRLAEGAPAGATHDTTEA